MIQVVVSIIRRDGKVLVAERPAGKPYSGYWEFPGGKIEPQESPRAALKRELHEELGIEVLEASHWHEHIHAYPDKTVTLHLWQVTAFAGEPQSMENQALRWVTWVELQGLRLLEGNLLLLGKIKELFE